jgi:hypothetical protein
LDRPYIADPDALVTAAQAGDHEALVYLLERGASLETRDERGCTALMAAVEEGYVGLAQYLVERGADVSAVDGLGDTPLAVARYLQYQDLARFLEEHGATARPGASARERRDDGVYAAFDSVNAVRRLIDTIRKKEPE